MLHRLLHKPKTSILLLGPRGTGKSTWIRQNYPSTPIYDLLNTTEVLRLARNPSLLFEEVSALKRGSWVVLDEIQKVPRLLDEVHRLIEEKGMRFVLSGSSARKLKKESANLLAGRARKIQFFPLVSQELAEPLQLDKAIHYGTLPTAYLGSDPQAYLRTYSETYLQEEVKNEALTRNIGSFARFLEVAARQNGQVTNVSNIARDAQVARQTVEGYFEILVDTLIGYWLNPWKLKRATKQIAHPKFYFFDSGVSRSLSGRLPYPPLPEEMGALMETYILHELRAYLEYSGLYYPIYFWSSHDQVEVDLFLETKKGYLAIEIKSSIRWDRSFNKGLNRIRDELGKKVKCIGIYRGNRALQSNQIPILPAMDFLKALWNGDLIK